MRDILDALISDNMYQFLGFRTVAPLPHRVVIDGCR